MSIQNPFQHTGRRHLSLPRGGRRLECLICQPWYWMFSSTFLSGSEDPEFSPRNLSHFVSWPVMSWWVWDTGLDPPSSGPSVINKKWGIHFCKSRYSPSLVVPHFQELLEEVRKELQKVKEEIIEGEVFLFLFKHLFILEAWCPLTDPCFGREKGKRLCP